MQKSQIEMAPEKQTRSCLDVIGLTLIALLIILTYASTLTSPFVFDDEHNIKSNIYIRLKHLSFETIREAAFDSPLPSRPLSNLGFALNYYLHGENVVGYHAVNIVIHLLSATFFFFLVKATLATRAFSLDEKATSIIALLSAFLWSIHPVQVQSVSYIVQRMNSQAAMFYVLSMLLYARARLSTVSHRSWAMFVGSLASGIFALGSKEIAATLPFFILIYEWFFLQDLNKLFLRRRIIFLVAGLVLMAGIAFYFLGGNPIAQILGGYKYRDFTLVQRLLTQPRVVLFYLSLIFFPHPERLNLDHDFPLSFSLLDPYSTSVSLIVITALCIAAIILARRHRLMSFGILWFFGNLVIESSIIGLEILFEHRLYLPSMFLMVAVVHLLLTRMHPKGLFVGLLLAAGTICTVWTYQRNLVWADPVLFWEDTIRKSPEKPRAYNNLGTVLFSNGQYQAAADAFREAIIRGPRTPKPNYNLASALMRMGLLDEAAEQLEITLRRAPANHLAHNNLALVRLLQGQLMDAEEHLRSAIRIKPDYANAYSNLGALMRRQGKPEEAIAYLERAIELDPGYAEAYNNLGYMLKQQGKLKTAIAHFEKALDLAPGYQIAKKNLEETRALLEASER